MWKLQLPKSLAVLDPVAQRDPAPGEPVVIGVVVGRDEEPWLDRLAAQLGQLERLAGPELHLALDGLLDRHLPSLGGRMVNKR